MKRSTHSETGIVVMASRAPSPGMGELGLRIVSGLVLAAVALAAVWYGSPWFDLLIFALAGLMAWEWGRVTNRGRFDLPQYGLVLMVGGAVIFAVVGMPFWGLLVAAVAAPTLFVVNMEGEGGGRSVWLGAGALYCALPAISLIWLREGDALIVFWILLLVSATDIGAYVAGRSLGGPKLAPAISPGKTWSGLGGGVVAAGVAGGLVAHFLLPQMSPWMLAGLSAFLGVVAQLGDLFESAVKRHFGVKDSSQIIPGHGGVLDRVDGMIPVILGVAALKAWGAEGLVP